MNQLRLIMLAQSDVWPGACLSMEAFCKLAELFEAYSSKDLIAAHHINMVKKGARAACDPLCDPSDPCGPTVWQGQPTGVGTPVGQQPGIPQGGVGTGSGSASGSTGVSDFVKSKVIGAACSELGQVAISAAKMAADTIMASSKPEERRYKIAKAVSTMATIALAICSSGAITAVQKTDYCNAYSTYNSEVAAAGQDAGTTAGLPGLLPSGTSMIPLLTIGKTMCEGG